MHTRNVSRRSMMLALGGAAVVAPTSARAMLGNASPSAETTPASGAALLEVVDGGCVAQLVAPLAVGAEVAGCRIERIVPTAHGAGGVVLVDGAGRRFGVEICAADAGPGAHSSPAKTSLFQLYVVNEGDGAVPTDEAHGLAAMAIANLVATNEATVGAAGFLTLRERLAAHVGTLIRPD